MTPEENRKRVEALRTKDLIEGDRHRKPKLHTYNDIHYAKVYGGKGTDHEHRKR
jgi:hypothetical protein